MLSTLPEARTPEQDMMRKLVTAAPVLAVRAGRADRSEGGGKAHVAEWRRGGAKRVLGDMGRGGGALPEGERNEVDGIGVRQVDDAGLMRGKRAGSVSERRREGCAWR